MSTGVSEIRVFIASPSDVATERQMIREAENRVNAVVEPSGFRVRITGWEQTPPGMGRPQSQINPQVDACDIFVGVLARRWGMSTGEHDSGFAEEFERVSKRAQENERSREPAQTSPTTPRVAIYFKRLERQEIEDAGPQLKKVLAFQQRIISDGLLLYSSWNSGEDLVRQVSELLTGHVVSLMAEPAVRSAPTGALANQPVHDHQPSVAHDAAKLDGARQQLAAVLQRFESAIRGGDATGLDTDRLELMASSFGADRHRLGAPLVNRLFQRRHQLQLSAGEFTLWAETFFADLGSSSSREERVIPGWGVVLGDELERWFTDTGAEICRQGQSDATTGVLKALDAVGGAPNALWHLGSKEFDGPLWGVIVASQPDEVVLSEYIVRVVQDGGAVQVLDDALAHITDASAFTILQALRAALDPIDPHLDTLALSFALSPGPLVAQLLSDHVERLSVESLFSLSASKNGRVAEAGSAALAGRGAVDRTNVLRLLKNRTSIVDDLIVELATKDPAVLDALKQHMDKTTFDFEGLEVLHARVMAAALPAMELRARLQPWSIVEREALMFADPTAMAEYARRVIDDDAHEEREELRTYEDGQGPRSNVEDFLAGQLRAAACRLLSRLDSHTAEDSVRVAEEVLRTGVLEGPRLLGHLSQMVAPHEVLEASNVLRGRLDEVRGFWSATDIEGILKAPLGSFLAGEWRDGHEDQLSRAAHIWTIRNEAEETDLVEYLYDKRPAVRMAAVEELISRLSRAKLSALAVAYVDQSRTHWFNVVVRLDEHLSLVAPAEAMIEPT